MVVRSASQLVYAGEGGNNFVPVWGFYEFTSNNNSKLAELNNVTQLKVSGNMNMSELRADVKMYEVVFVVMLLDSATKWDVPLKLKLILPDGMEPSEQERTQNLVSQPRQKLLEILAGEFQTVNFNRNGTLRFSLDIQSQDLNSGLVIKSVIVRSATPQKPPPAIKPREINVDDLLFYRYYQKDHWIRNVVRDSKSNVYFDELELIEIVWLQVTGKFDASKLIIGSSYEVVFLLRLNKDARGWDNISVDFRLNENVLPQMIDRSRYQGKEFRELKVGVIIVTEATLDDGILFSLSETKSGVSKKGLIIKGALLHPV